MIFKVKRWWMERQGYLPEFYAGDVTWAVRYEDWMAKASAFDVQSVAPPWAKVRWVRKWQDGRPLILEASPRRAA